MSPARRARPLCPTDRAVLAVAWSILCAIAGSTYYKVQELGERVANIEGRLENIASVPQSTTKLANGR